MIVRKASKRASGSPAPLTESEVLLEHANIMRNLAADMASQHLTLMLVGDGSPMNNLVRDTVGANRRSSEDAAGNLQRLAREQRLQPTGLTLWQFVLRLGLSFALGITIAPFTLMAVFWVIDQVAPVAPRSRPPPTPTMQRRTLPTTPDDRRPDRPTNQDHEVKR